MELKHIKSNKEKLLQLIKEFIDCSKYVCSLLEEKKGKYENIITAVREKKMPKQGYLEHDIYYNFHGIGCFLEWPGNRIEIDFGPNNRCDGFDVHRLQIFLFEKYSRYPEFENKIVLQETFRLLESEGLVFNPKWEPSVHLYYLNKTEKDILI